ncbi:aldehyde dehydrogenase family protein [Acinetobacter vivianii]|uniref:aldehyde dehydrogenase family protein n=1 Tax=Acinetobacter vivianii TaxID=1776742 RepID=UPI002DB73D8F|nr:aldehyde dehydrogenase family protein [Acinetobacter vivianii]MEB6667940.1 aldehyde dehydrogenase family protein [Acinetobacter vivianii]
MEKVLQNKVETIDLWIGGKRITPIKNNYFNDLNPEDDSIFARVAEGEKNDIEYAVLNAHEAFKTYRHSLAKEREEYLLKTALLVEKYQKDFVNILIKEVGSPIGKALYEVEYAINCLRAAAGIARRINGQTLPSDNAGRFALTMRQPLGVVGAITPFNVPLLKSTKLSSSPLATGNTVVLLPSEEAPMITSLLVDMYHEAGLPPGTINMVTGKGAIIGDSLTTHPLVKAVMFTGSSRVGKHIGELCGSRMKRCLLELGGKSPLVILEDADIEAAVDAAVSGQFFFQGQACMASSRIYVDKKIEAKFLSRFIEKTEALTLGDLDDPNTFVGPIISQRQRDRIQHHIQDAFEKGAKIHTGGVWIGNRCKPTILSGVNDTMKVFQEETFGPVTSVYSIDGLDEAIEWANKSNYGLSSAIFTKNLNHAFRFMQEIEAGMVHVNAPTILDEPHVPFGGVKDSGFGREGTDIDVETLTELKWATINLT